MKSSDEGPSWTSQDAREAPSWTDLERVRYQRRLIAASLARVDELRRNPSSNSQDLLLERAYLAGFRRELKRLETGLSAVQVFDGQCSAPRDAQKLVDGSLRQRSR